MLEGDTTPLALSDCLGEDGETSFVRNLLISEATGKFVEIAISTLEYRFFASISKTISARFAFIPAVIKYKILITTAVVGNALSLGEIHKEWKEVDGGKTAPNNVTILSPNIPEDFKKNTKTTADANIQQLSELLKNPQLSQAERTEIQTQLNNWNMIKSKFS